VVREDVNVAHALDEREFCLLVLRSVTHKFTLSVLQEGGVCRSYEIRDAAAGQQYAATVLNVVEPCELAFDTEIISSVQA